LPPAPSGSSRPRLTPEVMGRRGLRSAWSRSQSSRRSSSWGKSCPPSVLRSGLPRLPLRRRPSTPRRRFTVARFMRLRRRRRSSSIRTGDTSSGATASRRHTSGCGFRIRRFPRRRQAPRLPLQQPRSNGRARARRFPDRSLHLRFLKGSASGPGPRSNTHSARQPASVVVTGGRSAAIRPPLLP